MRLILISVKRFFWDAPLTQAEFDKRNNLCYDGNAGWDFSFLQREPPEGKGRRFFP